MSPGGAYMAAFAMCAMFTANDAAFAPPRETATRRMNRSAERNMAKHANFKTVDGVRLGQDDFAYAPGDDPAEWKLPVDARHIRAALEMFARTELPAEARRETAKRIADAAAAHGVKADAIERFRKRHLFEHGIPVLLSGPGAAAVAPAGAALHRPGAALHRLTVAVTGSWVKEHPFSITPEDLERMAANFAKRKNEMVVIDYEHASEQPEVAKGGPVPAAGWIHELAVSDQRSAVSKLKAASCALIALVEWTLEAERMISNGEYRFFSPAIDWSAADKETGELQGATLTSGALTNHPFLEELPPVMLSDGRIVTAHLRGEARFGGQARNGRELGSDPGNHEGANAMKKLRLTPVPEGEEHAGDHAVYEEAFEQPLGVIPHAELAQYAARHLGANPDDAEDADAAGNDEAKAVEARATHRRTTFLSEAVRQGRIDTERASQLAESGRITLADYIHAQQAERLVEAAIATGKILPRDRAFFFRDAMERPEEFEEYARSAPAVVHLGTRGFSSAEAPPVDQEVHIGATRLMNERGLDYAKALKEFLSANPPLGEQYRRRHSSRVDADGAAN